MHSKMHTRIATIKSHQHRLVRRHLSEQPGKANDHKEKEEHKYHPHELETAGGTKEGGNTRAPESQSQKEKLWNS